MYSCDMGVEWTCISKCSDAVGAAVSEWLHCNMLVAEKALVEKGMETDKLELVAESSNYGSKEFHNALKCFSHSIK